MSLLMLDSIDDKGPKSGSEKWNNLGQARSEQAVNVTQAKNDVLSPVYFQGIPHPQGSRIRGQLNGACRES